MALGDVYRARQQIETLAQKLLAVHRSDEDNIQKIVKTLTKTLGSHDYTLSRTEARELLGPQVASEDANVEHLVWQLFIDYSNEMELREPFDQNLAFQIARAAGIQGPIPATVRLAFIESADSGDTAERVLRLTEVQVPTPVGPTKGVQQEVVRAGWRHYI